MTTKSETYIWNREAESLSRADLEKLQLTRLKQIIEKVYNRVPLFKTRCHESNLNPQSLRSIDDLSLFPFTSKTDLRDHYPFGLSCQPLENVRRLHASSGTKGKPTVVGYTDNDLETWKEACARSLACAGARPADVIHNAYGYGLFTGGLGMHYGAEKLAATVVPASGGRTQQQILLLQDLQARVILSTPSYALNIAYTMHDLGIKRESINLEIGIFGAEPWTEQLRFQIEQILEIRALDIYGLSEVMGPGISMECMEGRNGLHIWEDLFYPEIIDPQTEETLPLGKEGELVFTSLVKEAIPLIRYKTGDISSLDQDK
ncbi:MAG: AMP-binding protein, partial [Candidatus Obscuribacterales bacterium]|nr:AMP-binding protein [Candidatus Obscuribacterales bacterium]